MPESVTRERYFTAAIEILSQGGFRELKMTALHERLGLTSGSFYHYFKSWPDFVRQFLSYWTKFHTDVTIAANASPQDPVHRLMQMRVQASRLPHDAEAAIRIWSAMDPIVAAVQHEVDHKRKEIIRMAVVEATGVQEGAGELANLAMTIIVGHQLLCRPTDVAALDVALEQFVELVLRRCN
jgi:AcrR family transcriptional regulator